MKTYIFEVISDIYHIEATDYLSAITKLAIILKKEKKIIYIKQINNSKSKVKIFKNYKEKKDSEKEYKKVFVNHKTAIDKLEKLINKKTK